MGRSGGKKGVVVLGLAVRAAFGKQDLSTPDEKRRLKTDAFSVTYVFLQL